MSTSAPPALARIAAAEAAALQTALDSCVPIPPEGPLAVGLRRLVALAVLADEAHADGLAEHDTRRSHRLARTLRDVAPALDAPVPLRRFATAQALEALDHAQAESARALAAVLGLQRRELASSLDIPPEAR